MRELRRRKVRASKWTMNSSLQCNRRCRSASFSIFIAKSPGVAIFEKSTKSHGTAPAIGLHFGTSRSLSDWVSAVIRSSWNDFAPNPVHLPNVFSYCKPSGTSLLVIIGTSCRDSNHKQASQ